MNRSERSELAAQYHRGTTPEIVLQATVMERTMAEVLKGRYTRQNCPVDVIVDDVQAGVEIKTIQISAQRKDGDQIHMNKRAKERKRQYAADRSLRLFTVVIDLRHAGVPSYYVREGIGSFRLKSMRQVISPKAVRRHLLLTCKGLLDS